MKRIRGFCNIEIFWYGIRIIYVTYTYMPITPHQLSRSTYGVILFCSILLTVEHLAYSVTQVISTLVISMLLVALAESYAEILAGKAAKRELFSRKHKHHIVKNSLAIFIGSEVPILLFCLAYFSLITLSTAFLLSKILIGILLFWYSYKTARMAKQSTVRSLVTAAIGTSVVVAIIILKYLWH